MRQDGVAVLSPGHSAPESTPVPPPSGADPHKVPIDPNGNLASKTEGTDSWAYDWNANNELTRVTKNSVEQARFAYDPLGRRVEKVAGGVTTAYVYAGVEVLRERRGAGSRTYVHGPGIDATLAVEDGGTASYYHSDALGSVVAVTSQAGSVTHLRGYDAWGNLEGPSNPGDGPAFTGREWDSESELYYYRARYYDSRLGRFISEDPIGFKSGTNFCAYVHNQPTRLVDPLGLDACPPKKPPEKCTVLCFTMAVGGTVFWCDGGRLSDRRGRTCCPDGLGFFDLSGPMRRGRCIAVCEFDCSDFAGAGGWA